MSKPRYSAEEYRVLCIILVVIIAAILWGWHNSERNRLKLLDEYETKTAEYEEQIAELKKENESMQEVMSYYDLY